jgi:hypothetical protein
MSSQVVTKQRCLIMNTELPISEAEAKVLEQGNPTEMQHQKTE